MRNAFVKTLTEMAEKDSRVTLIVGDLGFGVVADFAERFPNQFLNIGVAEQNMTGVAAGMAMAGRIVFTYSIANFPTIRCLEQVRNDVCYHKLNVVVVCVGGGFTYGALGMTHHATEDLAIMRSLPNMTVFAPGDPLEADAATRAAGGGMGPVYLRLGRAGEPIVHEQAPIPWAIGRAIRAREGTDGTLISTGGMLATAVEVANRLSESGQQVRILSMPTLKPFDSDSVLQAAEETDFVVTLEEHTILGGLGSAVAEVLAESGCSVLFKRIGVPATFTKEVGSQDHLRRINKLDPSSIVETVRALMRVEGRSPGTKATAGQRL